MKKVIKRMISSIFVLLITFNLCIKNPTDLYANAAGEASEEITVYANISEDVMQKYIEGFMQKYPQITVKYTCLSNYEEEIKQKIEADAYGDVLMVPGYLPSDDHSEYFEALGDYNTLSEKYRYIENCKAENGYIYRLPSLAYTMGIMYNEDVFYKAGITEIPTSIEGFLSALEAIKERTDAIPFYTNYTDAWALSPWETFPYIEMTGNSDYQKNLFVDEIEPFLAGSTHYEVYGLLYEIVNRGLSGDTPLETNWEESKKMLNNGDIGCMAIGSWALTQFEAAGENGDAVAFMPFPNEINGKQYMTITTDYCYGISKNSQHKEAARAYIDYMLDESGYALNQKTLSIVKTDPFPDAYGSMENVVLYSSNPATNENNDKYNKLSAGLNLEDTTETKRIIEAAAGITGESFDDIMTDWNTRWEAERTWEVEEGRNAITLLEETMIEDTYEVEFSKTEQSYLKEKESLKIGYLKNMAPFQFENHEGFCGVASYICDVITETTGISAEYIAYENTGQMLNALENGEIELAAGMEKTAAYNAKVQYSKGYADYMYVLIKNEAAKADTIEKNKMATVKGEESKWNTLVPAKTVENTLAGSIKAVERLQADFTVSNYYSANYYARQENCLHIIMIPLSEEGTQHIGFAKNVDSRLISIVNKCIYSIPKENIQLQLLEYLDPEAEEVTLKRYIEANPFQALAALAIVLLFILAAVVFIMREKEKRIKERALDMERYQTLSTLMDEYIFEGDFQKKILHFDKKFLQDFTFGGNISWESYQGNDRSLAVFLQQIEQIRDEKNDISSEFQLENRAGEVLWYKLIAYTVKDSAGNAIHLIGKMLCVQSEVEEKIKIQDKAEKDPLTGIYNREGLQQKLAMLSKPMGTLQEVTLAVMDLDNFKGINDTLGHAGGDTVLQLLGDTLKDLYPEKSIAARYGGDEFVLFIWNTNVQEAEEVLNKLVTSMDREVEYQNVKKHISISLGAAHTKTYDSYQTLFEQADETLYQVKKNGKNSYKMQDSYWKY
ncbi:MAG: GGDEF domain-containing protein [Lachnospiraceae bacterium]|nr:GGDEF domain-containing protein [Lachnospiraceae bacterium]